MTAAGAPGAGSGGDGPPALAFTQWDEPEGAWMLSGASPTRSNRTVLLETAARFLFPTVLVFSVYLLVVGHYAPGGGFSGGLVAGLAFVLRYIAGGGTAGAEIGSRLRLRSTQLVGGGLLIAVLAAFLPLTWGAPVLSSRKVVVALPVVGEVDVVSSLLLDVGVYVLLVGVVLDLLRSLGSGIEQDAALLADPAAGGAPRDLVSGAPQDPASGDRDDRHGDHGDTEAAST